MWLGQQLYEETPCAILTFVLESKGTTSLWRIGMLITYIAAVVAAYDFSLVLDA